jgi:hypothetical protein
LFTSNKEENRKSIKKLASLKPAVLCFGHGPVLKNKGELESFLKRCNCCWRTACKLLLTLSAVDA